MSGPAWLDDVLLPDLWPRLFWHLCSGMFAMDHLGGGADLEDLPPPVFPDTFCGGLVTRLDAVATRPLAEVVVTRRHWQPPDATDEQRVRQRQRDVWSAWTRAALALAKDPVIAAAHGPLKTLFGDEIATEYLARPLRAAIRPLLALRATARGWRERLPWRCIFYQLWDYVERGSFRLPGHLRLGNAYASIENDRHLAQDYFCLALLQLLRRGDPPLALKKALYAHIVRARQAEQAARGPRRSKRQRVVYY
jgi:hypothetical protein